MVLKPPYALEHYSTDVQKAFLIGFIDGDGCIRYDKRDGYLVLEAFSASLKFIQWIKRFLETEYSLPNKSIYSYGPRKHTYRLYGRKAELALLDLRGRCINQMARKWFPIKHPKRHRNRSKMNLDNVY